MATLTNPQLGFILVIGAGLATSIGASVVYSSKLIKFTSKAALGAALGLSSGVMLYVSFIEIFVKGLQAFIDAGISEANANLYVSLCFFSGVLFMKLLNRVVHWMDHSHLACNEVDMDFVDDVAHRLEEEEEAEQNLHRQHELHHDVVGDTDAAATTSARAGEVKVDDDRDCHSKTLPNGESSNKSSDYELLSIESEVIPKNELEQSKDIEQQQQQNTTSAASTAAVDVAAVEITAPIGAMRTDLFDHAQRQNELDERETILAEKRKDLDSRLQQMGLMTALAIGLHNFPEGLATFVATLSDPAVGGALAVAIAIHNIPEGLAVSVPIFFATNNRHRAFLWGVVSGLSEIVGAGLGWLVLKDVFSELVFGILFGLVAGMMVAICIYELLPTARRYDPSDKYVSNMAVVGMAVMAASLVAFKY